MYDRVGARIAVSNLSNSDHVCFIFVLLNWDLPKFMVAGCFFDHFHYKYNLHLQVLRPRTLMSIIFLKPNKFQFTL